MAESQRPLKQTNYFRTVAGGTCGRPAAHFSAAKVHALRATDAAAVPIILLVQRRRPRHSWPCPPASCRRGPVGHRRGHPASARNQPRTTRRPRHWPLTYGSGARAGPALAATAVDTAGGPAVLGVRRTDTTNTPELEH